MQSRGLSSTPEDRRLDVGSRTVIQIHFSTQTFYLRPDACELILRIPVVGAGYPDGRPIPHAFKDGTLTCQSLGLATQRPVDRRSIHMSGPICAIRQRLRSGYVYGRTTNVSVQQAIAHRGLEAPDEA